MGATLTFDQELDYPSYDRPFLESWNGRFEAVLVVLNPFFTLPGIQPVQDGFVVTAHAQSASGRTEFAASSERTFDEPNPILAKALSSSTFLASISHPEGVDWIADADSITWAEAAERSGLGNIQRVAAALLGLIGGLRRELVVKADLKKLVEWSESDFVFLPTEGSFQPLLLKPLTNLFRQLGQSRVIFHDELGRDPAEWVSLADIENRVPYRGSLYDEGKTIVAVVDWDSHFTLVAGPRESLEQWRASERIDAFFADETTGHDWWLIPSNLN